MSVPGSRAKSPVPSKESQRLFFAILPNQAVREALYRVTEPVRSREPNARFVHPEDLHLTLLFLGQVPQAQIHSVMDRAQALSLAGSELILDRLHCFKRGRLLCCGTGRTPGSLQAAYNSLLEAMALFDFKLDPKPYCPHITLARKLERCQAGMLEHPMRWRLERLSLVRSETSGPPPRYHEIWSTPLTRSAGN